MKLLIICEGLKTGGIRSSLISFLRELDNKQIAVDLYLFYRDNEAICDLPKSTTLVNIPELDLIPDRHHGIKRIFWMLKRGIIPYAIAQKASIAFPKTDSQLQRRRNMCLYQKRDIQISNGSKVQIDLSRSYDIVISWGELLTDYVLAQNIICKKKYGWIHPDYLAGGFNSKIDHDVLKKLDGIVSVSLAGYNSLRTAFPDLSDRIYMVPNIIDIKSIREKAVEFHLEYDSSCFNIVTVARIQNASKAFDRSIHVVKSLIAQGYRLTWHIVGDGEDRSLLEKQIDRDGLRPYFQFHGMQSNPYPYMAAADLFVLQSYYEGRPVVVDEAMIVGTPVLVTDYTSANEQVMNGVDGAVVANNKEAIAKRLMEIIDNSSQRKEWRQNLLQKNFSHLNSIEPFFNMVSK